MLPDPGRDGFLDLRDAVGCDTLPITTVLCPVGECGPECLCRERVEREARKALFGRDDKDESGGR